MSGNQLRIRLTGSLADTTALALGGEIAWGPGSEVHLVTDYVDQSQLTGLLVQLGDLHIDYDLVVVDRQPAAEQAR